MRIDDNINIRSQATNKGTEMTITETQYQAMWQALQTGNITETEWKEFCFQYLKQIVAENKDVMIRLKYR